MAIFALIGIKGLYLLFAWLLSAAIGAWVAERKGYGERVGLGVRPAADGRWAADRAAVAGPPGSLWKTEGRLPKRGRG